MSGIRRVLLATLLIVSGCAAEPPGQTVRFGYNGDLNGASVLAVANRHGLWRKHGLNIEPKVFTNGPVQIQAMGAGDLDFGYIGPGAFWLPASGRASIVAINSIGLADRLIAQPDRGISSVRDLKGKKIAVPEGTSGEMILHLALEKAGLSTKDVQRVAMDPSTVVAAFSSGQVDAAGIWYPLIDTIKQRVPNLVELATNDDFAPAITFPTAFVARTGLPQQNPELTTKVLRVLQEANDHRARDIDGAVTATAELLKIPAGKLRSEALNVRFLSTKDLADKTHDGTVGGWLNGMAQLFVAFGKLPRRPEHADYYLADLYTRTARP